MPDIFKALATILVWVLWICGMLMGFSLFILGIIHGDLYGSTVAPMEYWAGFSTSLAFGVGAVVVMILRKKME